MGDFVISTKKWLVGTNLTSHSFPVSAFASGSYPTPLPVNHLLIPIHIWVSIISIKMIVDAQLCTIISCSQPRSERNIVQQWTNAHTQYTSAFHKNKDNHWYYCCWWPYTSGCHYSLRLLGKMFFFSKKHLCSPQRRPLSSEPARQHHLNDKQNCENYIFSSPSYT